MIGVFDSGVGGLTVVKEIFKYLPDFQIIYFGDTARLPYGTKGADFVKKYSAKITNWLLENQAQVIIVACHTSSAWASDFLKEQFKGTPIFEMITPGAKEAIKTTKKIGIIGTPGTIKSNSWNKKLKELKPGLEVYSKSCPLFVPLVEEGWTNKEITRQVVKEYLKDFKNIDSLILACTHYPILEKLIKREIKARIINPAESLVKELRLFLNDNSQVSSKIKKGRNHQFFFSDQPYNLKKISKLCLGQEIKPKIINEII
jgi:glutamate racemase